MTVAVVSTIMDRVHTRAVKVMQRVAPGAAFALTDLALACPEHTRGYRCLIERARDRTTVGCLEGDCAHSHDPLRNYCFAALSDGTTFELVERRQHAGRTDIWHNGHTIGRVACTREDLIDGTVCPTAWDLFHEGRLFGEVSRGLMVRPDSLWLHRIDGPDLPLLLPRKDALGQLVRAIGRVASLKFLSASPPANRHLIVAAQAARSLSDQQMAFYFAAVLLFRAGYFRNDSTPAE